MRKIEVISERTDREWAPDHPLRLIAPVVPDSGLARARYLICTIEGEPRLPALHPDYDVLVRCVACNCSVVKRSSAAAHLKPMCWKCWEALE